MNEQSIRRIIRRELSLLRPLKMVSTKEAASILGLKDNTLRVWRTQGKGPRYAKIEGAIKYRISDLDDYVESQMVGAGHD